MAEKENNFDINRTKLPEDELKKKLVKKVRANEHLRTKFVSEMPDNHENGSVEEHENQTINKTLEDGINGKKSPLYDEFKENLKNKDKPLHKQLYSHEQGKVYEEKSKTLYERAGKTIEKATKEEAKVPTKKTLRFGKHEAKVTDSKTGEPISKIKHGAYIDERKLQRGERTTSQKLQYQTVHQAKNAIKKDVSEDEQKEGNEGVQIAHSSETYLKNRVFKPFIRDNFGFDRNQIKVERLSKKATKLEANADVNKRMSEKMVESNPLSKAWQKKQIKKRVYKEKGLYVSPIARAKSFVGGAVSYVNPLYSVKQAWHGISTIIGALGGLLNVLITVLSSVVVIIVPAIAIVSILSLFFNFDSNTNVNVIIADTTAVWSEKLTDIRMELIEAEKTDSYDGYSPDEVVINGNLDIYPQQEMIRQIQWTAYLASYYQDKLTSSIAKSEADEAFDSLYSINVDDYVDEGWYETVCSGSGDDRECHEEWVEHWVLYLSLEQGDIDEYALEKLNSIPDEDKKELALVQYEQYQEVYGMGQIGGNPISNDNSVDWRDKVSSIYGYRIMSDNKEFHTGLDIAIPKNTPLYAIADGTITSVNANADSGASGRYVYYEFELGKETYKVMYLHLESYPVSVGDTIKKGDLVAYSGNTGRSTGPHLHLQVEVNGKTTNPLFLVEFPLSQDNGV